MKTGLTMAGAKGPSMMAQILPRLPASGGRGWTVPFFGTGAAARAMHESGRQIEWAADACAPLVRVHQALRDDPGFLARVAEVAGPIEGLSAEGQREAYWGLREGVETADPAAFLVVWRMSFNGLMRFSREGKFNASAGIQAGKPPRRRIVDLGALAEHGAWLRQIPRVEVADYSAAPEGPLYADPPYVGTHDTYTPGGFDHPAFHAWLARRPGPWAVSNSRGAVDEFPEVYDGWVEIKRRGTFSGKGDGRQPVTEVLAVRP
jgi:site-specific DNA-adenine methylase